MTNNVEEGKEKRKYNRYAGLEIKKEQLIELVPEKYWIKVTLIYDRGRAKWKLDIRLYVEAGGYMGITKRGIRIDEDKIEPLLEAIHVCQNIMKMETKQFYRKE